MNDLRKVLEAVWKNKNKDEHKKTYREEFYSATQHFELF